MYRILIVDDEPYVVDSLEEFLQSIHHLELDVCKAYSVEEAVKILDRAKIDVVLSDIRMPDMSGLELHREIMKRWPSCKVIFITGYDEFSYIQQSIRNGGVVDYILKTEGDDRVLESIERAIAEIETRSDQSRIFQRVQDKAKQAIPVLQKDYFMLLLRDHPGTRQIQRHFAELELPFNSDQPVLMCVGRIDRWPEDRSLADQTLFLYAIQNIAEEYVSAESAFFQINYDHNSIIWLFQPKLGTGEPSQSDHPGQSWHTLRRFICGTLETIQSSCSQYLRLPLSLALGNDPCAWQELGEQYDALKFVLSYDASGVEMALIDVQTLTTPSGTSDNSHYADRYKERQLRHKFRSVELLRTYLVRGEETSFFEQLGDVMDSMAECSSSLQMELFYSIAVLFLSYINSKRDTSLTSVKISMDKLTQMKYHSSWKECTDYFRYVAGQLFQLQEKEQGTRDQDMIIRIHSFIQENLKGDLSLTRIAELVHLHPFYLSRLYNQKTGTSLSDYITDAKMIKARHLLVQTDWKVHEIAAEVGYEFTPSFSRIFKKHNQLTPQEFRELNKS